MSVAESFMEDEIKIEETFVKVDCVKEEALDIEDDRQYRIALEYRHIFGESSSQRKFEEDYDNLIGFMDNDVIMENTIIKLEYIKEEDGSFNSFHCSKCKGSYKGYCLKCSTLAHILNNNMSLVSSESQCNIVPSDILEIRDTSAGKGVFLLRTLPIHIIFGPFEGTLGIESTVGHCWKINDNKLVNIKNGNWMKNIVCAPSASFKNLDIFQVDGNLYFQTNREIIEGEELFIYYDDKELRPLANHTEYLYTPEKQKLPRIFACTLCCLGFGSNKCLMEHKGKCPRMDHSRSMKDFELIECRYCKMWMEKWEHEEYHVAYCLQKHRRMSSDYSEAVDRSETDGEEMKDDSSTKDDKRTYQPDDLLFNTTDYRSGEDHETYLKKFAKSTKNEDIGNRIEKKYGCSDSSYQTNLTSHLQRHLNTHTGIKQFTCDICTVEFTEKGSLTKHIKDKHVENRTAKLYKCLECSYETNNKSDMKRHSPVHTGIKAFQCIICMMKFTEKSSLTKHTKIKHAENGSAILHKCSECSYVTYYRSNLRKHSSVHTHIDAVAYNIGKMHFTQKGNFNEHAENESSETFEKNDMKKYSSIHTRIKPFQCDICMTKFTRKYSHKLHMKNNHAENGIAKDYKCPECSYQTNYRSNLRKHSSIHNIETIHCDICMMRFTRRNNLEMHMKNKHTEDGSAKLYKCSDCSYETIYISSFKNHSSVACMYRRIKAFQCIICETKFTEKGSLTKHIKIKHAENGSAILYKCSECSYQTYYRSNLRKHSSLHNIAAIHCNICMMKFTQKSNLKMHMKNKHGENRTAKLYKCSECSYETIYISSFRKHSFVHTGIKAIQCDICMTQFTEKSSLKRHTKNKHAEHESSECSYETNYKSDMSIHTRIKAFQCDVCMVKFTQRHRLTMHIKNKHTGNGTAKLYKCSECSYETNYTSSLKHHSSVHTGIKAFQCIICETKFTLKGSLTKHTKNKHAEHGSAKDYKCSECSYETNYKSSFKKHSSIHTRIKAF